MPKAWRARRRFHGGVAPYDRCPYLKDSSGLQVGLPISVTVLKMRAFMHCDALVLAKPSVEVFRVNPNQKFPRGTSINMTAKMLLSKMPFRSEMLENLARRMNYEGIVGNVHTYVLLIRYIDPVVDFTKPVHFMPLDRVIMDAGGRVDYVRALEDHLIRKYQMIFS